MRRLLPLLLVTAPALGETQPVKLDLGKPPAGPAAAKSTATSAPTPTVAQATAAGPMTLMLRG
ncbi:MAG: hypothetical protein JO256_08780, partial [Alphaproteobacteria bacterium]|nr:hypothetical protein [Alphaproteobacteria bacterium]